MMVEILVLDAIDDPGNTGTGFHWLCWKSGTVCDWEPGNGGTGCNFQVLGMQVLDAIEAAGIQVLDAIEDAGNAATRCECDVGNCQCLPHWWCDGAVLLGQCSVLCFLLLFIYNRMNATVIILLWVHRDAAFGNKWGRAHYPMHGHVVNGRLNDAFFLCKAGRCANCVLQHCSPVIGGHKTSQTLGWSQAAQYGGGDSLFVLHRLELWASAAQRGGHCLHCPVKLGVC